MSMSHARLVLGILITVVVVNLFKVVPSYAAVESLSAVNKAYAVFVISYNQTAAIGGVAGTAFFVSPTQALTAYHVLQPVSFQPQAGYTHSRVWLVHENEPAIELNPSDVSYDRNNDLTTIAISKSVKSEFVYMTDSQSRLLEVETEGFRANSVGPRLERVGEDIEVTAVPTLDRIHLHGTIIQRARVDLHASDVTLNNAPCLQVSYEPIRGMSGGPLIADGKVIGLNSFADPRSQKQTWAIKIYPKISW